jgi:uncharacterized repeat protein (TIGR03803 family)
MINAQTFTLLHVFGDYTNTYGADGLLPPSSPVLRNGTLYGVTGWGGYVFRGTIYAINTDGTGYQILHNFTNSPDGSSPTASLLLDGNILYGTTQEGGSSGSGTIFTINTDGTGYTILHNFTNTPDGVAPGGMVLNGNILYGITQLGGSNGAGTVFSINTNGTGYTILHNFTNSPDGADPILNLEFDGNALYGITWEGGTYGVGTIFMVRTDGMDFNVLYNFTNSPDGANPDGLILKGGMIYGTTFNGGAYGDGTLFKMNLDGTGNVILHQFNDPDGIWPVGPVVLNGNKLYGATESYGPNNYGTIFQVNTNGTSFAVIQSFDFNSTGGYPYAGPVVSGSTLYGTAREGGGGDGSGGGTLYSLNLQPLIQSAFPTNGSFNLTWSTIPNVIYQVQYSADLASTNWCNLGNTIIASNTTTTLPDSLTNSQRFYRISIP